MILRMFTLITRKAWFGYIRFFVKFVSAPINGHACRGWRVRIQMSQFRTCKDCASGSAIMTDFRGKDLRYCAGVRVSARKAQRVASLCKKLKSMPTFMPISCKIVTKMVPKPIPKVWQIVPKSIKSRGCVADVFLERFGIAPRYQKSSPLKHFDALSSLFSITTR